MSGVLAWAVLGGTAPTAQSPTINYLTFTPDVLSDASSTLLVEVEMTATATSITLDFNPAGTASATLTMQDDGANGDRRAGDRIFTAQLPAAPILAARTPDDVNRVFIGYLNLFNGTTRAFRGNLFVDVYSSDAGVYPATRVSAFVQATSHIVNIHDSAYFTSRDLSRVTREFYRGFGDDYDFLNIVFDPMRFDNRTHAVVKNQTRGLGLPLTDSSATFGSAGRLLGISQFPIARFYDGAGTAYSHELGHQWISALNVMPFASGVPHWPYSTMGTGVMGISIGGPGGQGGAFPCAISEDARGTVLNAPADAPSFNDFDLYLMGLLPPEDVREQLIFADQSAMTQVRCNGQVFTGAVTRVGVQDIVRVAGPRIPAHGEAQSTFRAATILVTRDGLASKEMMSLYSWLTERAELEERVDTHSGFTKEPGTPFFVATRGRGRIDTRITPAAR